MTKEEHTYPDGLVMVIEYKYNKNGTLKSQNIKWNDGDSGKLTYSYDADGNLVSTERRINGSLDYSEEYFYYSNNDLAKVITTYSDGTSDIEEYSEYVVFYNEDGFKEDSFIY
jgi:YD repeat-containing protein